MILKPLEHTDDWFAFGDTGCTMLFPKEPSNQSQTVNTAIGEIRLDNHMYEVPENAMDDNLLYSLSGTMNKFMNSFKLKLL